MMKILLLLTISFYLFSGCYFSDTINTPPTSDFDWQGSIHYINQPVFLFYKGDSGNDLTFSWQMLSVPSTSELKNSNYPFIYDSRLNPQYNQFIPDVPGNYEISLTVEDQYGAIKTKTKAISIQNRAPIAIIDILTKNFTKNCEIYLSGEKSFDPDNSDIELYWSFKEIPENSTLDLNILSTNKNGFYTHFKPDIEGIYKIQLTVFDPVSSSDSFTTFYISKNIAPTLLTVTPDPNIDILSIKKGDIMVIKPVVIDDTTPFVELNYIWKIYLNGELLDDSYNGFLYNINSDNYGIGDHINIELNVYDNDNNFLELIWDFLIVA